MNLVRTLRIGEETSDFIEQKRFEQWTAFFVGNRVSNPARQGAGSSGLCGEALLHPLQGCDADLDPAPLRAVHVHDQQQH